MSALPSEADIRADLQHVCFVPNSDMADAKSQKSRSTAASRFMPDDCGLSGQFNVVKLKRTSDQRPTFTLKPDCFAKDLQISLTRCLSVLGKD
jgi:hypothetical protein